MGDAVKAQLDRLERDRLDILTNAVMQRLGGLGIRHTTALEEAIYAAIEDKGIR